MDKISRLRQLNKESYEIIAENFDVTRQKPWSELEDLATIVNEGSVICDLGCGNGRLLKAMPKVNFDYTGIDSNAALLAKARETFPNRNFIKAELETIDFGEHRFDSIFCIATFHHLVDRADRIAMLRKSYRALKPGGQLVMTVWNLWQQNYLKYIFKNISMKITWNDFFIPWKGKQSAWRYYHGFTKNELHALFTDSGFKLIQITAKQGQARGYNYIVRATK